MNKILKKELNKNLYLGDGNIKLMGTDKIRFLTWSIPPKITCPFKTNLCEYLCYAALEELRYPNVKNSRVRNLYESQKQYFVRDMIKLISYNLQRPKYKDKILYLRIHEAGDFYSLSYQKCWELIALYFKDNKRIYFQAYTKSLPFLKLIDLNNSNIKYVFSIMDDTQQKQIDEADQLHLTTFKALHQTKITSDDNVCPGVCGPCVKCYKGEQQNIIVALHGARKNKLLV